MEFFDAVNNVTDRKVIPDREEVEKMAWGVKRFLSMNPALLLHVSFLDQFHFTLGDERFYELMVYCMPSGRYRARSIKKDELPDTGISDELRRKVCLYFKIKPREIPVLLEVVSLEELNAAFGVQEEGRGRARKKTARRRKAKRRR